ncbi:MAG: hypothetical protein FJ144_05025 [Deltaproteobacteria bacterium]|nr:hypothetical protein [Deltaproteobacteria bacterium]
MKPATHTIRNRIASLAALLLAASAVLPAAARAADGPGLEEIVISPATLTLAPGESGQLTAVGHYEDDTTRPLTNVVWQSRNEDVATVDPQTGRVTAHASGEAEIKAEDEDSGKEARVRGKIVVAEIQDLSVVPSQATIETGKTLQLRALATLSDGRTGFDVTKFVTWTSKKKSVATVSDAAPTQGLVTAVAVGQGNIRAKDPESGEEAEGTMTVVPAPGGGGGEDDDEGDPDEVEEIELRPHDVKLRPGGSAALRAFAIMADGTERDVTSEVDFSSSDAQVATVAAGGLVTAGEAGRAKIEASHEAGGESSDSRAQIWVGEVESIDLSPANPTLDIGEIVEMSALATYDNGLSADITQQAEWSSEKTRVATVSDTAGSKGFVTGVTRGDATIVARDPASGQASKGSSGRVVVLDPTDPDPDEGEGDLAGLRDIVLDPAAVSLLPGETAVVHATGLFADGSTRDLTDLVDFRSRRSRTADVDETGVVTGKREGDSEIEAKEPSTGVRSRVPARVHVARMLSLAILPAERILAPGGSMQLQARANYDNGVTGRDVTNEVRWESFRTSVATVGNTDLDRGRLVAVGNGETEVAAYHKDSRVRSHREEGKVIVRSAGPTPTPGVAVPVGLVVTPAMLSLQDGETQQLQVELQYSDGSKDPLLESLEFRSSNRRVARVTTSGLVVAEGGGAASIEVEYDPLGFSKHVSVVVRNITSLKIDPATTTLRIGRTARLKALASFSDGTTNVDVTNDVSWRSDNPLVATLPDSGTVQGAALGTARIEVLDPITRVRSDASTGNVSVVAGIERVFLTPSRLALPVGGEKQYKAFGAFPGGATADITDSVDWFISAGNPPVASISPTGRVKGLRLGDATISARDRESGITSTASGDDRVASIVGALLALKVSTTDDIDATPSAVVLSAGETKSLKGLALFEQRTDGFNLGSALDWHSSNAVAVSVNASGLVTCNGVGVSTISVTDPTTGITSTNTLGNLSVTCSGRVVGLRTQPTFADLNYLATRQVRAFRRLEDGSEIEVTRKVQWTSSSPSIVSIVETGDQGGLATALGDGQATLVAYDAAFDVSSEDSGGTLAVLRTRKTRTKLELFPQSDAVGFKGKVGELYGFQARATYASGATQGVNLLLNWSSSNATIVQMGDGSAEFKVNQGRLLKAGTVTITGRYPADAGSPEVSASTSFEVTP